MKSTIGVLSASVLLGWLLVVATAAPPCPQCQTVHGPRYCPATPLSKDQILSPVDEGCARQQLQDLELDIKGTIAESQRLVAEALRCQPFWTPERRVRAAQECPDCLYTDDDTISRVEQLVADPQALVALGKAWFWEQRVGSDGQTACASCHYRAGADARPKSLGVALRALAPFTDPKLLFRSDGSERNIAYEDRLAIEYYENRWSGMMDFPAFYQEQAIKALNQASQRIDLAKSRMSEDDRTILNTQLHTVQLTGTDQACRDAWTGVEQRLANPVSGAGLSPEVLDPIRTLIELGNSGLILSEQAVPADATDLQASLMQARAVFGGRVGNREAAMVAELVEAGKADPRLSPDGEFLLRAFNERNAPTVVNSALHDRLFHDGRAASVFNGYDHLGDDAGRDGIGKWMLRDGVWRRLFVRIPNSALASQSTAPLLSDEMSWFGRQYHHVARKLLNHTPRPLADQLVPTTDSVLGRYVTPQPGTQVGKGLNIAYRDLIRRAFRIEFCSDLPIPRVGEHDAPTGTALRLTQIEANFPLFWGLALMAYQKTLISDQSEMDQILDKSRRGLSQFEDPAQQSSEKDQRTKRLLRGLKIFREHACADCHHLPEFAGATLATIYGPILEFEGPLDAVNADNEQNEFVNWQLRRAQGCVEPVLIESMAFRPNLAPRLYDTGYYNLSVTPDTPGEGFDPGNAGEVRVDLTSETKAIQSVASRFGQGLFNDLLQRPVPVTYSLSRRYDRARSVAIGSFKTTTLRNIALTPPYFHDGSETDLIGVMDHYANPVNSQGRVNQWIHPTMLALDPGDPRAPTAVPAGQWPFVIDMMNALTDPRVAQGLAPFDRPSLSIPTSRLVDATTGRTSPQNMVPVDQVQSQP